MPFRVVSKTTTLAASLALLVSVSVISTAQAADPDWFAPLRQQLADSQKCMAETIADPVDSGEGAKKVQTASVTCEDGRKIMAKRTGANAQFSFNVN